MRAWLPYIIGYGFATVVAHFPIAWLVDRLWISIGARREHWERRSGWWLPIIVGLVERALYVGSMIFCHPEFIGVWLALKVASKWSAWKDGIIEGDSHLVSKAGIKDAGRHLDGSSIFSIFLIGNGLSIGYAVIGFYLISEVKNNLDAWSIVSHSSVGALAILVATACMWCIAKCHKEKM